MMLKASSARAVRPAVAAKPRVMGRRAVVVKAEVSDNNNQAPATPEPLQGLPSSSEAAASEFKLLNQTTEALNGRSAMLGFVAAVIAESATHQSVVSQIAGRYADMELVEKPLGLASVSFGAVVALVTMATLAPKLIDGLNVDSKSFGPFTPAVESLVGRVAMMGFLGLVLIELVKGSSLL